MMEFPSSNMMEFLSSNMMEFPQETPELKVTK